MLDALRQDLSAGLRSLRADASVSTLAIVSLAVGIAANTTIFSLVHAVEFPELPYPSPAQLVFVESRHHERGLVGMLVSAPDAADLVPAAGAFEAAALAADQSSILRAGGGARRVGGRRVGPEFFEVFGMGAARGRVLVPSDREGAIVLSDALWRRELSADPAIVGTPVSLDGGVVTVVGVMPPGFDPDADFWTPLGASVAGHPRDDRQFMLFGRLRESVTVESAARELAAVSAGLAAAHPATNRGWLMFPVELRRLHGRDARGSLLLLQAAVGFVLLIACANIANLLLARATRRQHEMAVRISLGAGRGRLVRALLVEATILALAGGAAGVLLSLWGIQFALALGALPDALEPDLNAGVLGFTAVISIATGLGCGIVPALRASGVSPDLALRAGGRGIGGDRGVRLRAGLVAAQVALALTLTVCALLMVRTLANRYAEHLGWDPRAVVRGEVMFTGPRYGDQAAVAAAVERVLAELRNDPQARAAGARTWALPTPAGAQREITLPSEQDRALPPTVRRAVDAVTPGYFEALGAPLRHGRFFDATDLAGAAPVAIVDDALARHLWPGGAAVGQRLRLGAPGEPVPIVTVVGVVGSMRRSPMHDRPLPTIYVPLAQHPNAGVTFVAKTGGGMGEAMRALEAAVRAADGDLVVDRLQSVEGEIARFVAPVRSLGALLATFGLAGVLLAGLGIFGTMSYAVAQRQRDFAIRSALGAGPRDLLRLVLRDAMRMAAIGSLAGVLLAMASTRLLAGRLFGVTPLDPGTYVAATALLIALAAIASYRPARRAAVTDPLALVR